MATSQGCVPQLLAFSALTSRMSRHLAMAVAGAVLCAGMSLAQEAKPPVPAPTPVITTVTPLPAPAAVPAPAVAPVLEPPRLLRFASEGARPPYNYFEANNELAGFEIDLGKEICTRIKAQCSFLPQDWDSMIPGLVNNQFDAILAAMEITDERKEKIAFSRAYVRMPSAFISSKKSPPVDVSPTTLADKSIGVVKDGAHQSYAEDKYKNSEIRKYGSIEEAVLDIAEGRLDVALGDKDEVVDFLKNRKEGHCCQIAGDVAHDSAYFGDGIGIGLRKSDPLLKTQIDAALEAMIADGSYERIRAKYFDFDVK